MLTMFLWPNLHNIAFQIQVAFDLPSRSFGTDCVQGKYLNLPGITSPLGDGGLLLQICIR